MGLFSDIFGGTDKSAFRQQKRRNESSTKYIDEQSELARGDLLNLFGDAESASRAGTQAGLDIFSQTIPHQFDAFQQGNMNAQNIIAGGVRGARAALLGLPFQENFQAQPINVNTGFAQQQLPPSTFGQQAPASQGLQGLSPEVMRLINQQGGQF